MQACVLKDTGRDTVGIPACAVQTMSGSVVFPFRKAQPPSVTTTFWRRISMPRELWRTEAWRVRAMPARSTDLLFLLSRGPSMRPSLCRNPRSRVGRTSLLCPGPRRRRPWQQRRWRPARLASRRPLRRISYPERVPRPVPDRAVRRRLRCSQRRARSARSVWRRPLRG